MVAARQMWIVSCIFHSPHMYVSARRTEDLTDHAVLRFYLLLTFAYLSGTGKIKMMVKGKKLKMAKEINYQKCNITPLICLKNEFSRLLGQGLKKNDYSILIPRDLPCVNFYDFFMQQGLNGAKQM